VKKHVYRVTVNGSFDQYVAADTVPEARRIALEHVSVERLSAGDVIVLMQRGVDISGLRPANPVNQRDEE
jgi:hypothetical protein